MRILYFTDVHATRSSEFAKPTGDGLNEYLDLFLKSFEFVAQVANTHKPDVISFGGDLWDAPDYIDTMALNTAFRAFNDLVYHTDAKAYIAIVGNHDYYDIDNSVHTLEFLRPNWVVVDEPRMICLNELNAAIAAIPFRDKYDLEVLTNLNEQEPDLVLSHVDVVGGLRRAAKSDKDSKAFSKNGIPAETFNKSIVLNGHYHHPSMVRPYWYNVGALTSRTFHDKGSSPRGVVLYDTEDNKLQRLVNPHARQFIDVHIDTDEDAMAIFDDDHNNQYARIYYNLELENEILAIKDEFAGARLIPRAPQVQGATPTTVDLRFSLEENLERYINDEYNDVILRSLALEILQEASATYTGSSSREALDFGVLDIHNFQGIGRLTIDLRHRGLILVRGVNLDDPGQESNGSCKSTILEAIYWCITGKSLRGYLANEVIKWGEDSCKVSLGLFVGDRVYTNIRTRKDPELGNGAHLFLGGASAGARGARAQEKKLDDLIGRTDQALRHVCFLTDGLSHRFSKLSFPQRARLLEEIIDSKPYSICKDIADRRLSSIIVELSTEEGALRAYRESASRAEDNIEELQARLAQFTKDFSFKQEELVCLSETIKSQLVKNEIKLEEVERETEGINSELNLLDDKVRAIYASIQSKKDRNSTIQSEKAVLQAELERWGSLLNRETCPTCETSVDGLSIKNKYTGAQSQVTALDNLLTELSVEIEVLETRKGQLDGAIRLRKQHRVSVGSSGSMLRCESSKLRLDIASLEKEISEFEATKSGIEKDLMRAQGLLDELQPKITKVVETVKDLEYLKDQMRILYDEVFDERGVRNSILSQVAVPFINSRLPSYLDVFWPGKQVELSGYRSMKGGRIKSDIDIVFGGNESYKSLSRGQRRRIDWILQLALNDLAVATGHSGVGFLGVDEVLDSLDRPGREKAVEVLKEKAQSMTIFLVTHSEHAASLVSQQIVVTKEDGTATAVEQLVSEVME